MIRQRRLKDGDGEGVFQDIFKWRFGCFEVAVKRCSGSIGNPAMLRADVSDDLGYAKDRRYGNLSRGLG